MIIRCTTHTHSHFQNDFLVVAVVVPCSNSIARVISIIESPPPPPPPQTRFMYCPELTRKRRKKIVDRSGDWRVGNVWNESALQISKLILMVIAYAEERITTVEIFGNWAQGWSTQGFCWFLLAASFFKSRENWEKKFNCTKNLAAKQKRKIDEKKLRLL